MKAKVEFEFEKMCHSCPLLDLMWSRFSCRLVPNSAINFKLTTRPDWCPAIIIEEEPKTEGISK